MMAWQVLAKAGAALLTDRETRKRAGQALALVLSPLVLLVAFLCCLASGTAQHNAAAADLCFPLFLYIHSCLNSMTHISPAAG